MLHNEKLHVCAYPEETSKSHIFSVMSYLVTHQLLASVNKEDVYYLMTCYIFKL